ncbi:MAG TPA: oligosaccharide flippase family protein [Solirubrobacteraceae bacterium]|jgi:O-antigen/teichoic acid export membrane protein
MPEELRRPLQDAHQDDIDVSPELFAEADLLSTPEAGPAAVRGGAVRISSFLAGSLISVGTAALLFRHLGVVNTGRYTTALSLSAVVTGFTDLGLTAIGIRELAVLHGPERTRLARNLLGLRIVLTVIGVILISTFAFLAYGNLLGFGVLIAGAGVLVQNVQTTLAVPLMSGLRLGWVSALDFARLALTAGGVVVLVLAGAHLLPFLATPGVAAAIVVPVTAVLVRDMIPLSASFDISQWRTLLGPVLTYSAAVAASTLYFRVAIVIVSLVAGAEQLGYFSISFRVVEVLFTIPGLLVGAAFPIFARAARDDPERLGYALSRVFEVSLMVGVWIALSIAVGAHLAIQVIGGSHFLPATPVLAVQGIAVGATFVSTVFGYGMLSLHLHRLILMFNLAMLALVAVVVAILTSVDGAQGAAIGTASVEVVAAVGNGLLLVRGRPHLAPRLRAVPRVAVAALLGATPALAVGLPVVVRVFLSTAIYAVVLLALRAPPRELLALVPARFGGRR